MEFQQEALEFEIPRLSNWLGFNSVSTKLSPMPFQASSGCFLLSFLQCLPHMFITGISQELEKSLYVGFGCLPPHFHNLPPRFSASLTVLNVLHAHFGSEGQRVSAGDADVPMEHKHASDSVWFQVFQGRIHSSSCLLLMILQGF